MKQVFLAAILCMTLPGCAVVGIGLAGLAVDNVANGEDSYTNQGLDYTCDRTSGSARRPDGSCPSRQAR